MLAIAKFACNWLLFIFVIRTEKNRTEQNSISNYYILPFKWIIHIFCVTPNPVKFNTKRTYLLIPPQRLFQTSAYHCRIS